MSTGSGFFFWKKKKETRAERVKEILEVIADTLPQFRDLLNNVQNVTPNNHMGNAVGIPINPSDSDGIVMGKLYDFYQTFLQGIPINATPPPRAGEKQPADERQPVNPKSVLAELEGPVISLSLEGLDEKIQCLQDKTKLTVQYFAAAQINGMIERLEYRRRYSEVREFFDRFPYTTDEKIDGLISKYKLKVCTSDLFIPTLPKEAIDVMQEYIQMTQKITGKESVFYLIGEESDFKKKYEKLDPILLVQSPFGFVWQILGAWDKEMMLLCEL